MALVDPVIVLPGITATYLRDEYPLPPEYVWNVIKKKYDRVAMHPNDLRYEAIEPARLQPGQIFEIAYEEIVEELRYNLSPREDEPVPVYPFGYDWRMKLDDIEDQFSDFVDEVIDRTKLMKHYYREDYGKNPKVNLVGHSMGGLIIAGYLEKKGKANPVNKVVTIATPYQGSFEAVTKVTTGTGNLGESTPPSSRERESARITPALYHLLPSFSKGIETDPGIPNSLFNIGAWQTSIIDSIKSWVQMKGLPTKPPAELANEIFKSMLREAKEHRSRIDKFKLSNAGLSANDWLGIVGVDSVTRVHLKIIKKGKSPQFILSSSDRKNNWDSKDPNVDRRKTGDGTVPFEGAVPKFLDLENLVCISPDDYGYWEFKDKALTKLAGFHGIMPNMNMLHRLIVRFFKNTPDRRQNTWGRCAPGVINWKPPLPLREKK